MPILTEFGKVSRKLRIDRNLTLSDMAERTNLSASYISAVEIGKKDLTMELVEKYIEILTVTEEEKEELLKSASVTMNSLKIDLTNEEEKNKIALKLARNIKYLNDEQIKKIENILNNKEIL
ncbi:helix-turn-helix domain-containing protein [Brachyspira hyodysenteriae]|uniref:helix-turn-helix domain-containing protein n=1 Tax=Brachyspira hyodysenteriae TaxID=159 RepID=UPI003A8112C7